MPSHATRFLEKAQRRPTSPQTTPLGLSGLPPELLREGAGRLGLACLAYAAIYFFAFFGPLFLNWLNSGIWPIYLTALSVIASVGSIVMALALFVLTRIWGSRPAFLLDLGLIFLVVSTFGISMNTTYGAFPVWDLELFAKLGYTGIPWECVWIILFPLLAPNSPGKVLLASLAAASMPLLAILVSKAAGATSAAAPWRFFLNYYLFTTYLCALAAFFVSRVVMRFGARLKQARELGQYQMLELLGKGGMGEVWRARHRLLARPAAIKLIRPEASRAALLKRFEREAQATAALGSVHTIDVFDFGLAAEGQFYYVMELLDGLDLESFVKRFGPVPAGRVIHWLRQACHSLDEAHLAGLIHRDIKPANLQVCRLGPDLDFIKVLDFGLVKTSPDSGQDATQLTREGLTFGTPAYIAPEMAMGSGEVDGRADIYSLGCVAYWLLAGRTVFEGETPLAAVLHHVKTEPLPPSQRSGISVPPDLERVVLDCLAKSPAQRPPSAAQLAQRLESCRSAGSWTAAMMREWWDVHLPLGGEKRWKVPADTAQA